MTNSIAMTRQWIDQKIFGFDNEIYWKIFWEINLIIASKVKAEIYSIFYTEICVNGLIVGMVIGG